MTIEGILNNKASTVLGDTYVQLIIGDNTYSRTVLIADITDNCILELDFLKTQQCVVDIAKGGLKFPDQEVCVQGSETCYLCCVTSMIRKLIQVKYSIRVKYGSCIVVEDSGQYPSWITARTLLLTKDTAKERVLNISDRDVHFKKNSVIGKCSEVSCIRRVNQSMRLSAIIQWYLINFWNHV